MHFIHKEDHVPAAPDLRQHIPQPLLKFAPVLRPCHQARHIQAIEPFFLQLRRHVAHRHTLGQALGYGGLSHARLPDQGGIVFILPAENADHRIDLSVPANDRVHAHCLLNQILAELFQKLRRNRLLFPVPQPGRIQQIFQSVGKQCVGADAAGVQHLIGPALLLSGHGQQHMGGTHLPSALPSRLHGSLTQNSSRRPGQPLGQRHLRPPYAVTQHGQLPQQLRLHTKRPQQLGRTAGHLAQGEQQVHRAHIAVAHVPCLCTGLPDQRLHLSAISHEIPPLGFSFAIQKRKYTESKKIRKKELHF